MDLLFRCFYCFERKKDKYGVEDNFDDSISVYSAVTPRVAKSHKVSVPELRSSYGSSDTLETSRNSVGSSDNVQLYKGASAQEPSRTSSFQSLTDEDKMLNLLQQKRRPTQSSIIGQFNPELYKKRDSTITARSSTEDIYESVGQVAIKLAYDTNKSDFLVSIVEVKDLIPCVRKVSMSNLLCEPCVRVSLKPDVDPIPKERLYKSRKKSRSQRLDHTFKFPMTYQQLEGRSLRIEVLDNAICLTRSNHIGEVVIDLDGLEVCAGIEATLELRRTPEGCTAGELQCQLVYLPSAERLVVTIHQARSLRKMDITGSSDPYVKVCLNVNGRPVKKKKTAVIRQTTEPKWNEQLYFNLNEKMLKAASLEMTVLDKDLIGHSDVIGWLRIGSSTKRSVDCPEDQKSSCLAAAQLWKELMQNKSAASMWLPLSFQSLDSGEQAHGARKTSQAK